MWHKSLLLRFEWVHAARPHSACGAPSLFIRPRVRALGAEELLIYDTLVRVLDHAAVLVELDLLGRCLGGYCEELLHQR